MYVRGERGSVSGYTIRDRTVEGGGIDIRNGNKSVPGMERGVTRRVESQQHCFADKCAETFHSKVLPFG